MLALVAGCATRVIDGDTLVIHYDGKDTSVRLTRVNAPERNAPGRPAATGLNP